MAEVDPDLYTKIGLFTKKYYRDVYPAIEPTRPELSLVGKVTIVTGAGRGLGRVSTDPLTPLKHGARLISDTLSPPEHRPRTRKIWCKSCLGSKVRVTTRTNKGSYP